MTDEIYDRIELLTKALKAVVDAATADLSEVDDMELRQHLTETIRFWRN